MTISIALCFFVLLLPLAFSQLKVGFYGTSCPKAESIVMEVVEKRFKDDKTITPALGCDASILINFSGGNETEKEAGQNASLRGFDLIDEVKEKLEEECPSTVSCADIITLATRGAVALSGGPKYEVPTGRRDGLVSLKSKVDLPGPRISVQDALTFFDGKGIKKEDMVSLMGGHTVGVAGGQPLDAKTPDIVDNEFYKQILQQRGVLPLIESLLLLRPLGILSPILRQTIPSFWMVSLMQ